MPHLPREEAESVTDEVARNANDGTQERKRLKTEKEMGPSVGTTSPESELFSAGPPRDRWFNGLHSSPSVHEAACDAGERELKCTHAMSSTKWCLLHFQQMVVICNPFTHPPAIPPSHQMR